MRPRRHRALCGDPQRPSRFQRPTTCTTPSHHHRRRPSRRRPMRTSCPSSLDLGRSRRTRRSARLARPRSSTDSSLAHTAASPLDLRRCRRQRSRAPRRCPDACRSPDPARGADPRWATATLARPGTPALRLASTVCPVSPGLSPSRPNADFRPMLGAGALAHEKKASSYEDSAQGASPKVRHTHVDFRRRPSILTTCTYTGPPSLQAVARAPCPRHREAAGQPRGLDLQVRV
jgi:hypothetical protein